ISSFDEPSSKTTRSPACTGGNVIGPRFYCCCGCHNCVLLIETSPLTWRPKPIYGAQYLEHLTNRPVFFAVTPISTKFACIGCSFRGFKVCESRRRSFF